MLLICLGLSLQTRAQSTSSPTAPTHKTQHKPRTFQVDDFPVTDKMFGSSDGREVTSGPLHSSDMAWFTNNHIGQTLVILIYTDNFRNAFFLFRNDDIPPAIKLLYWCFKGESNYDGRTNLHGKPLAADSFGYEITMCFRNNGLIGLIHGNDIP